MAQTPKKRVENEDSYFLFFVLFFILFFQFLNNACENLAWRSVTTDLRENHVNRSPKKLFQKKERLFGDHFMAGRMESDDSIIGELIKYLRSQF